jgi:hypothetical protein
LNCASISQKRSKQTFESHWIFQRHWIFEGMHFERFAAFAIWSAINNSNLLKDLQHSKFTQIA